MGWLTTRKKIILITLKGLTMTIPKKAVKANKDVIQVSVVGMKYH